MMLSILIPSRFRPQRMLGAIESVVDHAAGTFEIIVGLDEDDAESKKRLEAKYSSNATIRTFVYPLSVSPSGKVYEMAKAARGDAIMMVGDDELVRTAGFDKIILSRFPKDGIACLYSRDDPVEHRGRCSPIITRKWYEIAGFYPRHFWHFYADTWVSEIAKMIGRLIFVPEVVIEHLHPKFGKGEWDQIYARRGQASDALDLWNQTEGERIELAAKLKSYIESQS